jgi:hypothetical protein
MGVLREVLAHFSTDVDVRPLNQVDRQIAKLTNQVKMVGVVSAAAFGAAAAATWKLLDAASSANETWAALNATVGKEGARSIDTWSKRMGAVLGRSEFDLQSYAQQFSAFLEPQFKNTEHDIVSMSKRLGELAVDLAAFYDTSDAEAQMRLFSGMSGETEAVRRLGIDISETSLSDYNHKKGDSRNLAQLTLQEKTLLRFEKIMDDTAKKQGHAAKEAQQWAGSLKRLEGFMKTVAVKWGRRIMETSLNTLRAFEKIVVQTEKWIDTIVTKTYAIETLMGSLATGALMFATYIGATALALPGVVAYLWEAAAAMPGIAAGLAAFVIAEDVVGFFNDADSVTGRILNNILGVKDSLSYVKEGWQIISIYIHNALQGVISLFKMMVEGAKRVAKSGAALATGDLNGSVDAWQGFGFDTSQLINPEQAMDELNRRKEEGFDAAVAEGDLKKASQFSRTGEGADDAYLRARERRKQMVESGEVLATQVDLDSGFVRNETSNAGIPGAAPVKVNSIPEQSITGGARTISMPVVNITPQTTITVTNANLTKEELQALIQEQKDKDIAEAMSGAQGAF